MPQQNTHYETIHELDSLRGLAAILVVLYHIPFFYGETLHAFPIIRHGYLAVDLFFVLSGFVIFNAYSDKIKNFTQLFEFQFLRFGRLYPVHITIFCLFLVIDIAKDGSDFFDSILNRIAIFNNIFLTQSINPINAPTRFFNAPAWSISAEFFTYFIFAVVIFLSGRLKNLSLLMLFIGSGYVFITMDTGFVFTDLIRCITGFSLGCLTAILNQRLTVSLPRFLPFVIFVGIILLLFYATHRSINQMLLMVLSATLILSITKSKASYFKGLLRLSWFIWLGSISYALYMSHWLILRLSKKTASVLGNIEVGKDGILIGLTTAQEYMLYGFVLLIMLFVSTVIFHIIERPWRLKSKSFVNHRRAIRASIEQTKPPKMQYKPKQIKMY